MSKKNLKLIMELIFIFILPLIFMCFTSEIQVERNFEYDNEGNYQVSQDIKNLSFDNSIIKYQNSPTYVNFLNFNQMVINGNFQDNSNWFTDNTVLTISNNIGSFTVSAQNGDIYQTLDFVSGHKYLAVADVKTSSETTNVVLRFLGSDRINTIATTSWQTLSIIVDSTYNGSSSIVIRDRRSSDWDTIQVRNIMCIDLTLMYGLGYEPTYNDFLTYFNEPYYNTIDNELITIESNDIISSNYKINYTIWGNIKNIVIDYLDVNDNVLLDLLLCYLFLWFFMFLIWHTFYRFFDWIFHLSLVGGKDNG